MADRYLFCEPFAGSAALTYYLLGAKPPISYMGGKTGYAPTIAACLGLSPRQRPAGIVLGEVGPMAAVHAVLGGAAGSAAEVGGMVMVGKWTFQQGDQRGAHRLAFWGPDGRRPELGGVAVAVAALPHPRAAEVAAIIRGWAGEEPRALWERLRREGWPSLMPVPGGRWLGPQGVEEVARYVHASMLSYVKDGSMASYSEAAGIGIKYTDKTGRTDFWRPTTPNASAERIAATPAFPPLAVWQGTADTLSLPADLSGWTIYADPPYLGDGSRKITGYPHGTCSRETVLRLAREWSDRGAVVGISECVGLAGALGAGWHEVEITHGRRGQKRTFSVQNEEWLTMNTPPQHAPHRGQVGLFVQTASLSFGGAAHSASSGAPD